MKGEKAPDDYGQKQSMMQIRSDWVTEETGFSVGRSTKKRLRDFSFIRYTKVEEFTGLVVEKNENHIVVTFHNTFTHAIKTLRIGAHYEIVFGKPTPRYITNSIDILRPGQKISLTFPVSFKESRPSKPRKRTAKFRDIFVASGSENFQLQIQK